MMISSRRWSGFRHLVYRRRWQLLALFCAVFVPLAVFSELGEDVLSKETFRFDEPILLFVHHLAMPLLDRLMLLVTRAGYLGGVVVVDVSLLCFLLVSRRTYDGLFFGLSVVGASILNLTTKQLFGRVRPKLWESIAPETTFSFPSGHAMGSMALVVAVVILLWSTVWRVPALVLGALFVLLVGFSRVYLGVHYPSDILAGWTASFAWVMGLSLVLYGRIGSPAERPHATSLASAASVDVRKKALGAVAWSAAT